VAVGACQTACATQPLVQVCGQVSSELEASVLASGSVVLVSQQIEDGASTWELFFGKVLEMFLVGIPFYRLGELEIGFEDGQYEITTSASRVGFTLVFAEDFGDFSAGEVIPYNVFDVESYARDIQVGVGGTVTNPRVTYDIEPGPLAGILDGSLSIQGDDPRTLRVEAQLDLTKVAIAFAGERSERFVFPVFALPPVEVTYEFGVRLASNAIPLLEFVDAVEGEGVAFTYDDSWFNFSAAVPGYGPFVTIENTLYDSELRLLRDADGAYFEGTYGGTHGIEATFFGAPGLSTALTLSGVMSSREANTTEFYCDAGRTEHWGTATHREDLTGGVLRLEDGTVVEYGLVGAVPQ